MLTFQYDLDLQQGASLDKTLYYSAGNPRAPVDLTGCTAWLVIRLNDDKQTQVLRLDTGTNGLQVGNGFVRIMIQRVDSQKFVWDNANWALFVQYPANTDFPAGFVQKLVMGAATVEHSRD